MTDFSAIIVQVRENAGPAPRKYEKRHHVQMDLMQRIIDKVLSQQVKNTRQLIERGLIVWGALVQANNQLFSAALGNAPGNVLFSKDPRMDSRPEILLECAQTIFSYKGLKLDDPMLQRFADDLADERGRGGLIEVPPQLTDSIPCYMMNIQFERKHLPGGYIDGSLFPLLALDDMPYVMVLPYWYWPEELLRL